jgi:hypothetical protein
LESGLLTNYCVGGEMDIEQGCQQEQLIG